MGRRQVLELVDQQHPGEALASAAGRPDRRAAARWRPSPARRSRPRPARPAGPVRPGHPVEIGDVGHLRLHVAGSASPSRTRPSASIHGAAGSVSGPLGKGRRARRAVCAPRPPRSSTGVPHSRSPRALSVRTRTPPTSARRCLHLVGRPHVVGHQGHGLGREPPALSSSRARSVSTLVLPEPAGAMIRAPAPASATAAELVAGQLHRRPGRPAPAGAAPRVRARCGGRRPPPPAGPARRRVARRRRRPAVPSASTTSPRARRRPWPRAGTARSAHRHRGRGSRAARPRRWPTRRGAAARPPGRDRPSTPTGCRPVTVSAGGTSGSSRPRPGVSSMIRAPLTPGPPELVGHRRVHRCHRDPPTRRPVTRRGAPGPTTTDRPRVIGSGISWISPQSHCRATTPIGGRRRISWSSAQSSQVRSRAPRLGGTKPCHARQLARPHRAAGFSKGPEFPDGPCRIKGGYFVCSSLCGFKRWGKMPAVTVNDVSKLARVPAPDRSLGRERSIKSVTTAPQRPRGRRVSRFAGRSPDCHMNDLDPFVHMDQMGEVDYAPGEPKGTPWHPHRGFETVTYMIDGTFRHQDSHGGGGLIQNGATQWMTAGKGILHIETPPEELVVSGRTLSRHPTLGQPACEAKDDYPRLPGPRGQ